MSIHKRLPELIRTVGEELQFLLQPRIWGSVSVVAVVGIFFWQFSEHPEWFSLEQESTLDSGNSASQLTPEEQSIAADIDSSKVLLDELNRNNSFLAPLNTTISLGTDLFKQAQEAAKKSESSSNSNPIIDAILSGSAPKTQPSISVQENTSTPANNLNSVSGNPSTPSESNPNFGLNQSAETTNPQTTTALQQAMQNYLQTQQTENKDLAVPSNTATESSATSEVQETQPSTLSPNTLTNPNAALNPLSGTTVGVTPFTGTPTITGQAIQPSWSVPRANTNPAVGTVPLPAPNPYQTNVTLPPVVPTVPTVTPGTAPNPGYSNLNSLPINNTAPSYSVTPNTGSYNTVQPVQPNSYMTPSNMNPNLQPGQIGQTQPNFSVPNRVPGRYIGGGEINTFANP